ncbi:MAG TPA: hypothetical protein VNO14_18085 [Blastocatellia bacterium]|nr:hypothetical protein [Blastocatellia bacterium]
MISYDDIRQLQQYKSGPDSLIISLYVDVDQSNAANLNRGFETAVENLFRQMAEKNSIDESKKQRFEAECQRILRFLNGYTPRGKGLVVFSDLKQDFWWQRDLQVEIPTELRWSPNPWVRPLLEVLEEHDRFAVVLIDKQHARIFSVDAIGIEQQAEIISDVPNKHATTGTDHIWSQGQMERDHTKHIKWHARRVAEELAAITDRLKITKLIVGGPVEATSIFVSDLPKRLEQMIMGTISVPVDSAYDRLLAEVRAVQEKAEREEEVRLVESMITSAHKGDRAVLGIADTLAAIQEGRIYCMVVAKDYRVEGKQCSSCQVLVVDGADRCSFCGGRLDPAPDLINRASHRVIGQAGKVYMVSGVAAEKLASQGVGAVLRF